MDSYGEIFKIFRGGCVESIHYGSIAVVDNLGKLIAYYGNPNTVTFLRSIAKPIQAIPFVEKFGMEYFNITDEELAAICSSHSGMDHQIEVIRQIQQKIKISENDLLCGIHFPIHKDTANRLIKMGIDPSPNHHDCSGNHTGIIASIKMQGFSIFGYNEPNHPIQTQILDYISELCFLDKDNINVGIDGCSIPTFGLPIKNAATSFARICNPIDLASKRADACNRITSAMVRFPEMVAGPGRLDYDLMAVTKGKLVSKTGIEGYQIVGVFPSQERDKSLGIAVKISDGDLTDRARPAVVIETLRQLNILNYSELEKLNSYGPYVPIFDSQKRNAGEGRPTFKLEYCSQKKFLEIDIDIFPSLLFEDNYFYERFQ